MTTRRRMPLLARRLGVRGSGDEPIVTYFCGVRIAGEDGRYFVDPANWQRLRLLLEPFDRVLLVAVKADGRDHHWMPLPEEIGVRFAHSDFLPLGTPATLLTKVKFAANIPLVAWRLRREARGGAAIGLVWLVEPTFFAGLLLWAISRRPLMGVVIGLPKSGFGWQAATARNSFSRAAYRSAAAVAERVDRTLATHARLLLVSGEGLAREIGAGVPFSTCLVSERHIRARHDSCCDAIVSWVYAGGVSFHKGVDTFLEALALTRAAGHDHRAVLVGHWDPDFPLEGLLERHGLASSVVTTGKLSWTAALDQVNRGDVFVFLSRHEGMPKAPLEAMAQGLPVVATPTGAEQYLVDGENGLLVPVGDAAACRDAVLRLAEDGDLRRRVIRNGLETARAHAFERNAATVRANVERAFPTLATGAGPDWDGSQVDDVKARPSVDAT